MYTNIEAKKTIQNKKIKTGETIWFRQEEDK